MIPEESYRLLNGVNIPKLGLGTWQMKERTAQEAASAALRIGYRHIDTAAAYHNERGVGRAVRQSGIGRSEIFITSKVPAEIKTYGGAKESIEKSLHKLHTDYIDLMLIHAPKPWKEMFAGSGYAYFEENRQVWQALCEAYEAGSLRAVGVSNFGIEDIENITAHCAVKPAVNQICVHIGHTPKELIDYCKERDILVTAYSPNATGRLLQNAELVKTAQKYGVSVPQLCIRYCLQLGLQPIPKTTHEAYMRQNADLGFVIGDEDMQTLLNITP